MGHGMIEQAILSLAGRCDGANTLDGQGFNKFDTHFGHSMADRITNGEPLTPKMRQALVKMLPKYRRQFFNWEEIKEALPAWSEIKPETPTVDLSLTRLDYKPTERKFYLYVKLREENGLFNLIPSPRWIHSEKAWRYLNNPSVVKVILENIDKFKTITDEAMRALETTQTKAIEKQQARNKLDEGIKKANAIKHSDNLGEITPPLKNWKRREHQIRAFLIGTSLDSVALFMEQRTGKSPVSIAIAGHRFKYGQIKRLLIVSPLSMVGGWKREFAKMADFPHRVEILDDKLEDRRAIVSNWKDTPNELQVLVTNYDVMSRMSVDEETGNSVQTGLMVDLKKWKPDMIICDETQRIKKGKSRRSRAMHQLGPVAKYRVILTGTPITQSPLDIFSQYKFLDPNVFGTSFGRFRDRYVVMGGYGNYKIVGYKILPHLPNGKPNPYYEESLEKEFFEKVHGIAFRVTRSEVSGLDPVEPQTIYATLENKAEKIYKEMEDSALLKMGQDTVTAPIVLTQLLRLQQITGGFVNAESGEVYQVSKAKLKALESKLEDLLEDEKKTVIFARFSPEIAAISDMLKRKKISHHVLEGGVKRSLRDKMIEDFQDNPSTMVFVVQISTGGEGITLSSGSAEIFYSANFSLTDYEQAKARIMDMDSPDKEIYNIVVENTVDELIMDTLNNKRDIAKLVVDDLKDIFVKKGDSKMARVNGSRKAQGLVDGKESLGGTSKETDRELDRMLDELEKELKQSGKSPDETTGKDEKGGRRIVIIPATEGGEQKGAKGTDRKPHTNEKQPPTGETVTLKELASELKTEPAKLRKWLRGRFGQTEGRWEWAVNDPNLKKIKEEFGKKGK